ncbi:hypothetical protein D9611_014233 [Ephemerocybe angulata]|uniref:Gal80p-like C-terminal domain-containing protein n=1 Tax=Ephemerocybe angulata TaxID=980116 RepID=A0A8H5EZR7_9AGAR|nr:hypothetical protein D9611_014233 [Tulosesus angulatus]
MVKKVIDYGKIGKIRSSTFVGNLPREPRYYQPEANDANLYSLDKTNGATLLTIPTAHKLSAFIYLLGPFATVSATGSRQYPTIDIYSAQDPTKFLRTIKSNALDHFTFSGSLKSGAHASITWKSGYKSTPGRKNLLWIIDGEEGSVTFEADDGNIMGTLDQKVSVNGKPVDEYMKDEGIEWVDDPALVVEEHEKGTFFESIRREWVEFGKSLRGGHGEFVSLDDAIEVQRVVDAVERSVELGGLGINLI